MIIEVKIPGRTAPNIYLFNTEVSDDVYDFVSQVMGLDPLSSVKELSELPEAARPIPVEVSYIAGRKMFKAYVTVNKPGKDFFRNDGTVRPEFVTCKYCGEVDLPPAVMADHEETCSSNPDNRKCDSCEDYVWDCVEDPRCGGWDNVQVCLENLTYPRTGVCLAWKPRPGTKNVISKKEGDGNG